MFISKTRFINWTRCPMYFALELKYNPLAAVDIDAERERREEMYREFSDEVKSGPEDDEEEFITSPTSVELEAMLPYYNRVEAEALKIAKKYFYGSFIPDSQDVHKQKLFEYTRNGHTYRCYADIYNANKDEINIIEVKATTSSKYIYSMDGDSRRQGLFFSDLAPRRRNANYYPLFVKNGNIWKLNYAERSVTPEAETNFDAKKALLLDRYNDVGKYPHDIAFQRFVITNALRVAGDQRKVNFYLAVLNKDYVYDGTVDADGNPQYNKQKDEEIVTFIDMNDITSDYQPKIIDEIETLENYIVRPYDTNEAVPVGQWCAWAKNTQCLYWSHCFQSLRGVPDANAANRYLSFRGFADRGIVDKYQLINDGYYKLDDIPQEWLRNNNHRIQRDCYDNHCEHVDKEKMKYWLDKIEYPIYHFDFESFPCPLPRFRGEKPYRQSVFEFSLHIERTPGVCDKETDNIIFLNETSSEDEREDLTKAIVDNFEFNPDGSLRGTMLAQNTSFEKGRLEELADLFPEYAGQLLAIRDKSADLIHLLKTNEELFLAEFGQERAKQINYYCEDLSGSYSIKKTLPVLVPTLTYKGMDVGNGVQAYITYLNYDRTVPTFDKMTTKEERRAALSRYCQQDTWAMVEILRAVRAKIE